MTGAVLALRFIPCAAAGEGRPSPIAPQGDQATIRSDPVFPALDAAISVSNPSPQGRGFLKGKPHAYQTAG
jgi:hypothetical protein